jgi:hypothetical protein
VHKEKMWVSMIVLGRLGLILHAHIGGLLAVVEAVF